MSAALPAIHALTFFCQHAGAQSAPSSIAGSYRVSAHHDPSGDAHLMLLPDSAYVVVYFGGARVGRWSVQNDTLLHLAPTDIPPQAFVLYGRHHSAIGSRARIFYAGFSNHASFVGFGKMAGGVPMMQRVFNEDANCMSFPYVDTVAAVPDSILLMRRLYTDMGTASTVYIFANSAHYNDFVAVDMSEQHSERSIRSDEPFAALRKGGLYILDARYFAERGALPESEEDRALFAMLTTQNPTPDSVVYNPAYNDVVALEDNPVDLTAYTAVRGGDALVAREGFVEGAEYRPDFDFHDMSVLYVFRAVKPAMIRVGRFVVKGPPVFRVVCD